MINFCPPVPCPHCGGLLIDDALLAMAKERDALSRELVEARPVVRAAVAWRAADVDQSAPMTEGGPLLDALADAVDGLMPDEPAEGSFRAAIAAVADSLPTSEEDDSIVSAMVAKATGDAPAKPLTRRLVEPPTGDPPPELEPGKVEPMAIDPANLSVSSLHNRLARAIDDERAAKWPEQPPPLFKIPRTESPDDDEYPGLALALDLNGTIELTCCEDTHQAVVTLTPQQARDLAAALVRAADER